MNPLNGGESRGGSKEMSSPMLLVQEQPCCKAAENNARDPYSRSSKTVTHLGNSYTRFCELLTLAEENVAGGDFSAAVGLAQIAARYAFPGRVGLFGSHRLERLLLEVGKRIPSAPARSVRHHDENSRNILHVLSYGRPVGGDSRSVWRWMQGDHKNQHSVAITTQADVEGIYDVPEVLRQSAERSGGFLRTLSAPISRPMEQARELRALCQEMDVVVLHLFPYDIIPVLALAAGCDSVKTLFVSHSDHTFWVGASVAHSVVHLRRQSPHFLTKRRGLNPDHSSILPIPLDYSPPSVTPMQAKLALGYEPDVVLLLTIASPFKYSAPGQISFLELVIPVIARFPQAVLIAVGPQPDGAWRSASIQTNGKIVPLGTRWDNDLLYAAADVYLDSVPFSSVTSLLEAGSHGVPLLGYGVPGAELGLLGPGSPGLDNAMQLAKDAESYRMLLARLISDPEFRRRSGQRVQAQILSLHTGRNWIDAVRALYAKVERSTNRGCLLGNNDVFEASALNLALVQLYPQMHVRKLIANYIGALPYGSRLSVTWRLYLKGFDLCFFNLLPPPANVIVGRVGRWAKRVIRRLLRLR